jgi:RNA polymerase sigma factor (sigma-70 family)
VDTISDEEIISGIRKKDRRVFEYLYKSYYYEVRGWLIRSLSNDREEAKDVFQDALIAMYLVITKSDFILKCSFKTFLFSVINNNLLLKIRNNERGNIIKGSNFKKDKQIENIDGNAELIFLEDRLISEMKMSLFRRKFMELPEDCQKILKRFFDEVALRSIAKALGYKSENYVKKRKYLCKEFLKRKIEEDKYYKIIREHESI